MSIPRRLSHLPSHDLPGGVLLITAATRRSRLLGLMGLRALGADRALLLPRCRSVHTYGMRFAIDLVWLDSSGRVLRRDTAVAPGRVRGCRGARAVVEAAAGAGERVAAALAAAPGEGRLVAGPSGGDGAAVHHRAGGRRIPVPGDR